MAISDFNENVNIISALPNKPTLSATELKSEFDQGAILIKTYLNSTVVPAIEALEASAVEVVDSLASSDESKALSAAAGALLNATKQDKVEGLTSTQLSYITTLSAPIDTLLEAKQKTISYGTTLPDSLAEGDIFLLI